MIFLEAFTKNRFKSLLADFSSKLKNYCVEAYPPEYRKNYRGANDGVNELIYALNQVAQNTLDEIKDYLLDSELAIVKECRGEGVIAYTKLMDDLVPTKFTRKNDYYNRLLNLRLFLSFLSLNKIVRLNCLIGSHPKSTYVANRIVSTEFKYFLPSLANDFWICSTVNRFNNLKEHIQNNFILTHYKDYVKREELGVDTINQSFKRLADICLANGITDPIEITEDILLSYHTELLEYYNGSVPAYSLRPALNLLVVTRQISDFDFYDEFTKNRISIKRCTEPQKTAELIYRAGTKTAASYIGKMVQNVEEIRIPSSVRSVVVDYGYWADKSGSDSSFSPDKLDQRNIWIAAQIDYIRATSTEKGTIKQKKARLSLLNKYLFSYLPAYFKSGLSGMFTAPKTPNDFIHSFYIQRSNIFELENESKFTDGFQYPVSLPQFVYDMTYAARKYNTSGNNAGRDGLAVIRHFFDYLESLHTKHISNFRNPFLGKAKQKVGKKYVKSRKFVFSLDYWLGLRAFCKVVTNKMLDEVMNNFKQGENSPDYINVPCNINVKGIGDTSMRVGKVSMESFRQIKLIKDGSVIHRNGSKDRNIYIHNYISWAMMTLLLHSGLRRSNALWLDDRYCFNLICDGKEFQQLVVSTDKVKVDEYKIVISTDLVNLLKKVLDIKKFVIKANPKLAGTVPYADHKGSKWGDISPLFKIKNKHRDSMVPNCFSEIINEYESFLDRNGVGFEPTTLYSPKLHYVVDEFLFVRDHGGIDTQKCEISIKYKDDDQLVKFVPIEKKTLVTPHSLRTMTDSIYAPIVGADLVGKLMTGQSESTVGYYTKQLPDSASRDFINHIAYLVAVSRDESRLVTVDDSQINQKNFENDLKHSTQSTFDKYNAQSINFDSIDEIGTQFNGLTELGKTGASNIAYFRTHVCPVGGACPKKIVDDIGDRHCYACPLAVVTNNHLPAIGATIRALCDEIKTVNTKLVYFKDNMLETEVSELESQKTHCVAKASYWLARKGIAEESNDDHLYYVSDEGLELMHEFKPKEATEQEKLLLRLKETQGIPTLQSAVLSVQAARLRRKIQALSTQDKEESAELSDIEYLAQFFNVKSDVLGLSISEKLKLLSIKEE